MTTTQPLTREKKWLRESRRPAEWWFEAACRHAHADNACERSWQCQCGACRAARKAGPRCTAELLALGAARIVAYQNAMRDR